MWRFLHHFSWSQAECSWWGSRATCTGHLALGYHGSTRGIAPVSLRSTFVLCFACRDRVTRPLSSVISCKAEMMFVHFRNDLKRVLKEILGGSRWWFQRFVIFYPNPWGNDPIWRTYFSNGLVQPPARIDLTKSQGFHHSSFKKKSKTCVSRSWCSKAVYILLTDIYIYTVYIKHLLLQLDPFQFGSGAWKLSKIQSMQNTWWHIYIYICNQFLVHFRWW